MGCVANKDLLCLLADQSEDLGALGMKEARAWYVACAGLFLQYLEKNNVLGSFDFFLA